MQSTVSLFNLALARLGGDQLPLNISPQEDDGLGRLCENLFPHVLDTALERHDWSFARKRVQLAALPVTMPTNEEYAHRYKLPTDCLRAVYLEGFAHINRHPEYVIEGDALVTNEDHAALLYIARVSDPRQWPPMFVDALAWLLASELATARINDPQRQQMYRQAYEMSIANAVALDLSKQNSALPVSEWQAARQGGV